MAETVVGRVRHIHMNYWIFQSVPERYDLRTQFPKDDAPKREATWYATRYRSQMQVGDLVFFWLGGDKEMGGIYGWGQLTSTPYIKKNWDTYGVDVRYDHRLREHLSINKIRQHDKLNDMMIVRFAQATNFLLSKEEFDAIVGLLPENDRPH